MQGKINFFCVLDAGIVVNPAYPYIGASPDGKVFNPKISPQYGLLEVKCPFKQRAKTIEEALADQISTCYSKKRDICLREIMLVAILSKCKAKWHSMA